MKPRVNNPMAIISVGIAAIARNRWVKGRPTVDFRYVALGIVKTAPDIKMMKKKCVRKLAKAHFLF